MGLREAVVGRSTGERHFAGKHLIERHAKSEHVRGRRDFLTEAFFGRDIRIGANNVSWSRGASETCHAEVEEHRATARHNDVVWLHVEMQQSTLMHIV